MALVTGAGKGIGRAVAAGLAAEGANVGLFARTENELDSLATELCGYGVVALAFPGDVRKEQDLARCVALLEDRFSRIDVLMNCAGFFHFGPSIDFDIEVARELLETNVLGTFLACKAAGRVMLRQGSGSIVNFGSLLSFVAFPQRALYAASKGAVLQLTRVLGVEWAPYGVNVNLIAPGMIDVQTPHPAMRDGALSVESVIGRIPAARYGKPSDLVGPAMFLASDDARYINGQSLVVDGGWLSNGYV